MSAVAVTGANRGSGLEFARQYAADGWEVIAMARQLEKSGELRRLKTLRANMSVHGLDITSDESVQSLADPLNGKPIDVLILNSGLSSPKKDRTLARSTTKARGRGLRRMSSEQFE